MRRQLPFLVPALAAGLLLAGLVQQASAQNFQVIPNLTIPQYAVCLPGFVATPTTVGNNTTYVCRSTKLLCRQGWTPTAWVIEDPYHNPNFAYSCVPSHLVPR